MKRQTNTIHPSQSHLIYEVGQNTRVTPLTIQQILNNSSKTQLQQTMKRTFDLLQNLRTLKNEPQSSQLKQTVLQQLQKLKSTLTQQKQTLQNFDQYRFDIDKFYAMNKSGSIGMLQRKCKFTQKGVLEFEDGKKQPKLKEIIRFNNLIERYNHKTNISKLDWVKETGKYPYRIVLIDKNKADKGIYFQSVGEAYSVQSYLVQKYNLKTENGNKVKDLFEKVSSQRENQIMNSFVSKFKPYSMNLKQLRNSYEKSRQKTDMKMAQINSSRQKRGTESKYDRESLLNNKNRQSNTLSQYFINEKRGSNQILIEDTKTEVNLNFKKNKNNNIENLGSSNKKGVSFEINLKRLNDKLRNYSELSKKEFLYLWRMKVAKLSLDKSKDTKVRESPLKNKGETYIQFGRQFQSMNSSKDIERGVELEQDDRNELNNLMKFTSIELHFNLNIPLKPYLQVELMNSEKSQKESQMLKFSTFLSINQKHTDDKDNSSYYELIQEKSQDSRDNINNNDQILISSNYSQYLIRLTLVNLVTGDLMIEKQIPLDSLKVNNQKFTLLITNQPLPSNENNLMGQKQENSPVMSLLGTIQNRNGNNLISNTFNYLFMNLEFLSQNQQSSNTAQQLLTQQLVNNQNTTFPSQNANLLTLIPQLQPELKEKLPKIIDSETYHLVDQSCYLPIHELKTLSPSQQQLRILSITAQLLRTTNQVTPVSYRYLLILRMLIQSNLFPSEQQLQEAFIAIILKWSGQFLSCNNNDINLAKVIGFQDDQIDKTSQKITLSLMVVQFFLIKECPHLVQKMNRRNIPINLLCLEYCNNLLTHNYQSKTALSLLCSIFNTFDKSKQLLLILASIYLFKYHSDQLINCYKLQEVQFLLQNSHKNPSNQLFFLNDQSLELEVENFIHSRYNQYFSQDNKHTYVAEFEQIKQKFYEKQGEELRNKKQHRHAQKSNLIEKLTQINTFPISPPIYKLKPHCLHIFFVSVPKISGSLYLKTNYTEFECVDYEKSPYFVISNLQSKVQLQFIDSKSNHYTFDLLFDLGFGLFKHQFNDAKSSTPLKFQYWAGLFEQSSIQFQYKNIRDIQYSLSSQLTLRDLKYKINREFEDSKILRAIEKICFNNGKSDPSFQELSRKIKTAFSEFQNKVNQYDLFLHLVSQRKISLEEKFHKLFQFAKAIEQELFLSSNHCLDRIVLYDFIRLMDVPIKFREFEALYQNMLSKVTETSVPKVFKARFFFIYQEQREVKLENEVYEYIYSRAEKYVYTDIDIKELLDFLKPKILAEIAQLERQLNRKIKLDQGQLKLVISSQGEVQHYMMKVSVRNGNREFDVDEQHLPEIPYWNKLQKTTPKVLDHQRKVESSKQFNTNKNIQNDQQLTSALKIVSRFKPTNMKSSISIESRLNPLISQNNLNTQLKSVSDISQFQTLNLCKYVVPKFKRIIPFRYKTYSKEVAFRNFSFFSDMNSLFYSIKENRQLSSIKEIYLNNKKVKTLEFLNDQFQSFKLGASQSGQLFYYRPEIGLENNLHSVKEKNSNLTKVYFYTTGQKLLKETKGKALVNHGFGVIRWENVIIRGYYRVRNQKNNKQKAVYLILVNDKIRFTELKQLKSRSLNQVKFLGQITDKELSKLKGHKV